MWCVARQMTNRCTPSTPTSHPRHRPGLRPLHRILAMGCCQPASHRGGAFPCGPARLSSQHRLIRPHALSGWLSAATQLPLAGVSGPHAARHILVELRRGGSSGL